MSFGLSVGVSGGKLSKASKTLDRRRQVMGTNYTAVVRQDGEWWIGWVEEIPGVNSQGHTRQELLENLQDALEEALEMNRAEARAAAGGPSRK